MVTFWHELDWIQLIIKQLGACCNCPFWSSFKAPQLVLLIDMHHPPKANQESWVARRLSHAPSLLLILLLVAQPLFKFLQSLPHPSQPVSTSILNILKMHLQQSLLTSTCSGLPTATLGEFSASNAALLRLQSALCRISGAVIPESHARCFGKNSHFRHRVCWWSCRRCL